MGSLAITENGRLNETGRREKPFYDDGPMINPANMNTAARKNLQRYAAYLNRACIVSCGWFKGGGIR
jgi:hypothetical protein